MTSTDYTKTMARLDRCRLLVARCCVAGTVLGLIGFGVATLGFAEGWW